MSDTDITRAMREFLSREFPKQAGAIAKLAVDAPLDDLGILDSMGLLTLVTFVEARWGVKIPTKAYRDSFRSLQRADAAIEALRKTR